MRIRLPSTGKNGRKINLKYIQNKERYNSKRAFIDWTSFKGIEHWVIRQRLKIIVLVLDIAELCHDSSVFRVRKETFSIPWELSNTMVKCPNMFCNKVNIWNSYNFNIRVKSYRPHTFSIYRVIFDGKSCET